MAIELSTLNAADRDVIWAALNPIQSELTVQNIPSVASVVVPATIKTLRIASLAVVGDISKVIIYRRANAVEVNLPGVITSQDGARWIFAEDTLYPEWFGAKGDAIGVPGVGTDDTVALNNMLRTAAALNVYAKIPAGKRYRVATLSTAPSGLTGVLYYRTNSKILIEGSIYHDIYDGNTSTPVALTAWASTVSRANHVRIKFDGGLIEYAEAANPTGAKGKFGMDIAYTDDFVVERVAASGTRYGAFNVRITSSNDGFVDGGLIGLPLRGVSIGEDGFHMSGNCSNVRISGLNIRSGDDSLSFTHEGGYEAVNAIMRKIRVSDCLCDSAFSKIIKFRIDSASTGALIEDVVISNIFGYASGNTRLGVGLINSINESYASGSRIRDIRIIDSEFDNGPDKAETDPSTNQGHAVYIADTDNFSIENCIITGSARSKVVYERCNGGGVFGGRIEGGGKYSTLASNVAITSIAVNGGRMRYNFPANTDLTVANTAMIGVTNVGRWPFLVADRGTNEYNAGAHRILAVDNVNKYIEVEAQRPGGSGWNETTANAAVSFVMYRHPDVQVLASNNVSIITELRNPDGAIGVFVGSANTTSKSTQCTVNVDITNMQGGDGIRITRSEFGHYSVPKARGCKSSGFMMYNTTDSSTLNTYSLFDDSHDFDGVANPNRGFGKTILSVNNSDRYNNIRGRVSNIVAGSVTQSANVSSFTISGNTSAVGGGPYTSMNPMSIRLTPLNNPIAFSVTWNPDTAVFTVTTATAPGINTFWAYEIRPVEPTIVNQATSGVLATGIWNDSAIWDDSSVWRDS